MSTNTLFTLKPSQNKKLGKAGKMFSTYRPVTKTLATDGTPLDGTCPKACPFLTRCYANAGNVNIHQRRAIDKAHNLVEKIKELPIGSFVRHLVSGDFGMDDKLDDYLPEAIEAHKARPDVLGFSYTHHWRNYPSSVFNQIKNFRVNASCETAAEVREALAAGWTAVQVVPMDTPDIVKKDGYTLVICPQQSKDITCEECMLCARNRKAVIGFRAHGNNKAAISNIVEAV